MYNCHKNTYFKTLAKFADSLRMYTVCDNVELLTVNTKKSVPVKKLMTAADIEMALLEVLSEDENEPDSSESDTEEEIIEERSHSSDTEQSAEEKTDLSDDESFDIEATIKFLLTVDLSTAAYNSGLPAAGGGGRGEFACLFSGFGDPRFATELVALEDDAVNKEINCIDIS
ncbi:hypothetical protein C0J52_19686 [Blattella germanica]|nr:hypothetical protein C0J52_19686 [Blattella germanica]